jgi:ICE2
MVFLFNVLSSVTFLSSIILSVPLAFDVGGKTCGLAYSLSLATFYLIYSTLRLLTRQNTSLRWVLVRTVGLLQWLILPSLLIWSLNRFSIDAGNNGQWVERSFDAKPLSRETSGLWEWISGPGGVVERTTLGTWDKFLNWTKPVFQLSEGFCSLLVIQAAGQITRWLVNRERSDSWMVSLSFIGYAEIR